jgi:hypothetical protein
MFKRAILGLMAAMALAISAPAHAQQAAVESKLWLVPIQTDGTTCCAGSKIGGPAGLNVYNMGAREARISVLLNGQTSLGNVVVQPGNTWGMGVGGGGFVLVLASEPVIVSGWTLRGTTLLHEPNEQGPTLPGQMFDGQKFLGHTTTWNYHFVDSSPAFAIDCARKEAGHWACSKRLGQVTAGGTVGTLPTTAAPMPQVTATRLPTTPIQKDRERKQ